LVLIGKRKRQLALSSNAPGKYVMRATFLLIGSLTLVLGACSSKKGGSHAPPLPEKTLLNGKWKSVSEVQFLAGYDFGADGTM
jgi:hypothetical protein